ncbi:hypothetical protein TRVL_03692 [Trypanosoma vivax]|nr:hypothetical protein TRVL_03692 [Trypanosoma vivax]
MHAKGIFDLSSSGSRSPVENTKNRNHGMKRCAWQWYKQADCFNVLSQRETFRRSSRLGDVVVDGLRATNVDGGRVFNHRVGMVMGRNCRVKDWERLSVGKTVCVGQRTVEGSTQTLSSERDGTNNIFSKLFSRGRDLWRQNATVETDREGGEPFDAKIRTQ